MDSPHVTGKHWLERTEGPRRIAELGFVSSERTVARYLPWTEYRGDDGKKWLAFLHNYRQAIVAFLPG